MSGHQYEVEVKVLLGGRPTADAFLAKLKSTDPNLVTLGKTSQLNHYFQQSGDPGKLAESVKDLLNEDDLASLRKMLAEFDNFSLRARSEDGIVSLVLKAAKGDGDNDHALNRAEGEYRSNTTDIEELDKRILDSGFEYLSKWSRERTTYRYKADYTVCLDRNAGYGYLAEIEQVVSSEKEAAQAKEQILAELTKLGFAELPQDRLGRMFEHYNNNWQDYYLTDKTFTVT